MASTHSRRPLCTRGQSTARPLPINSGTRTAERKERPDRPRMQIRLSLSSAPLLFRFDFLTFIRPILSHQVALATLSSFHFYCYQLGTNPCNLLSPEIAAAYTYQTKRVDPHYKDICVTEQSEHSCRTVDPSRLFRYIRPQQSICFHRRRVEKSTASLGAYISSSRHGRGTSEPEAGFIWQLRQHTGSETSVLLA